MVNIIQSVISAITQWLQQGNPLVYGALFLVSMIVEIGIPVPFVQDTILLYVGFNPLGISWVVAPLVMVSLMAGRIAGASIIFWIARRLGPWFIGWLGKRSPKLLASSQNLGSRLGKRSPWAVAIARLTPGLLTPSSIAAGLFNIRYIYFCMGIIIASVITDGGEIAAGIAIRSGFTIAGYTPTPTSFVFVFLVFTVLLWVSTWLWRRLRSGKTRT